MDIKEEETGMGFFKVGEKKRETVLREDKQMKHQAWHVCAQQFGRKRSWLEAAIDALAPAQAALTAAEAEPINPETGEVRDTTPERAEVARRQRIVDKHQESVAAAEPELEVLRIAKDESAVALAIEEFLRGPLERMEKTLLALHAAHKDVVASPYGSEFSIPWLNDELMTAWTASKARRCEPPVRISRGATEVVEFISNYSAGTYGGGLFVPGDRASWSPELCSELVAKGVARWVTASKEGDELVVAARRRLAQRKLYDPETHGPKVDQGWSSNDAA